MSAADIGGTVMVVSGGGWVGAVVASVVSGVATLTQTMEDLDKLFIDMRENPKRYVQFSVFGKKDKGSKSSDSVESTTKVVETPNEE